MGMYTEFFYRAEIRKNAPDSVKYVLKFLCAEMQRQPRRLPEHEFFQCSRWADVAVMGSAYFISREPIFRDVGHAYELAIHSNMKNYQGQIQKFVHWVDPYVQAIRGDFLGYSLYEESTEPNLFFHGKIDRD